MFTSKTGKTRKNIGQQKRQTRNVPTNSRQRWQLPCLTKLGRNEKVLPTQTHFKPICKKKNLTNFDSRGFIHVQVLSTSTHLPMSNHCQIIKHWTEIYWWWKYDKYQQISLQFSAATHNFRAVSEHWPWYVQVEFQSQLHSCQGLYNLSHLWKKAFMFEPWFCSIFYC